jgi:PPK2 family polyphosphate:nucleotide phosphotransferase
MSVPTPVGDLFRVEPGSGPVDLSARDPRSTPGIGGGSGGGKSAARAASERLGEELADLQERLYAQGRTGGTRRVLLVLQGMDTSGKGGAVKHVAGAMNPAGLRITGFGAPTEQERAHDFLWRIEKALPPPGFIGVFDRSHYEDVLIVRVHDLVPPVEWEARYDRINEWEAGLVEQGVVLLKVMLHLSAAEQKERLLARLDDPTKHWKINPGDIDERAHWPAYERAYEVALERCSTPAAAWYVVPADRKWYRNWAVSQLLLETLQGMDLQWPRPDLDLDGMRAALQAS